ncbi:MAG: hypothetical protein AB7L92_01915 [Alphaproteobacteria bacterium]
MTRGTDDSYIIEIIQLGGSVKVSAFDPISMKEASVIVPPSTTREEMSKLAIKKLHYVMQQENKA